MGKKPKNLLWNSANTPKHMSFITIYMTSQTSLTSLGNKLVIAGALLEGIMSSSAIYGMLHSGWAISNTYTSHAYKSWQLSIILKKISQPFPLIIRDAKTKVVVTVNNSFVTPTILLHLHVYNYTDIYRLRVTTAKTWFIACKLTTATIVIIPHFKKWNGLFSQVMHA